MKNEREILAAMARDHEKKRQTLLRDPVLHAAAGMPSPDFWQLSERIKDSTEEEPYFDTNLPDFYAPKPHAEQIRMFQGKYPHLFDTSHAAYISDEHFRWRLSWLGRAFFLQYPYRIEMMSIVNQKLQVDIPARLDVTSNGIPLEGNCHLICTVERYDGFTARSLEILEFIADERDDFDFDTVEIPEGPKYVLDTRHSVHTMKTYDICLEIPIPADFYKPYGELTLEKAFLGCDLILQTY